MIAWVTKYALTSGIEKVSAQHSLQSPNMVSWSSSKGFTSYAHGEGKDWHRTEQGAIDRAEMMRVNKIASLKKSVSKLEQGVIRIRDFSK